MEYPCCPDCGEDVKLATGKNRTREILKGVFRPIPDDFEIPTCVWCGEFSMTPEISEPLDALLKKQLAEET